jgi:hypothetical protein
VVVQAHAPITEQFDLEFNQFDHEAYVELKPSHYMLHQLFPSDAPFAVNMLKDKNNNKMFEDMVQKAKTTIESQMNALDADRVDENAGFLKEALKDVRAENCKKARVAMVQRAETVKKERRISLGSIGKGGSSGSSSAIPKPAPESKAAVAKPVAKAPAAQV